MLENAGVTIFPHRAEIVGPHGYCLLQDDNGRKILIAAGGHLMCRNFWLQLAFVQ